MTTNVVLDALIKAAQGVLHGQCLPIGTLDEIVEGLKVSPDFDDFYRRSYREMMDIVESEEREQRRTNGFGRLVIHPVGELFQTEALSRELLPNVFSFIHLVLGDQGEAYGRQCGDIIRRLKDDLGQDFSWDAFYADAGAKLILWHTLVRVAASFKRYELRKDWFIKLMQYRPTTISLASNAFVTRDHDANEEPLVFGERDFCMFFHALFQPLKELAPTDLPAFVREFGADPHHLIGDFLVNMSMCRV
jgi:hypothetical protein